MSLNSIVNNAFERFRIIFQDQVEAIVGDTNTSNEEDIQKAAILDIIERDTYSLDFLKQISRAEVLALLKSDQIDSMNYINTLANRTPLIKELLEVKFIKYQNRASQLESAILSKKNKVLQKLSFLNHIANNYQRAFVEEFNNLEFISESTLEIDKNAKIATLPIASSKIANVTDIFLTEISNGLSGSLKDLRNVNPWYTVDDNEETVFEYNKLDSGPCLLGLRYTFNDSVINEIIIKTEIANLTSAFKIKNIIFESNLFGSKSIKELCDLEKQNLIVDYFSYDKNIGHSIKFLPIKCSAVTIEFEQSEEKNVYIEQINQVSYRKVFSISISKVQFISNLYSDEGFIKSNLIEIGDALNGCDYKLEIYPKNNSYYESEMYLYNSGSDSVYLKENKFNLIDASYNSFKYRLNLKKLSQQLNNQQIESNSETLVEMNNIPAVINSSSNKIPLNDVFLKETIKLYRTDILKRSSDINSKTIISNLLPASSVPVNNTYYNSINLPLELLENNEIEYYVGTKTTKALTSVDLEASRLKIEIGTSNLNSITPLKAYIPELKPMIIEKDSVCYISITESFELDKGKIKLTTIANDKNIEKLTINNPNENQIYSLGNRYVSLISLKANNVDYVSNTDKYTLNQINGKLKFTGDFIQLIDSSQLIVEYSYQKDETILSDGFEFWFKDNKVKGLAVSSNRLYIANIQESLKDSGNNPRKFNLSNKENIIVNSLTFSNQIFNGEEFETVEYIDGNKEFNITKSFEDIIPDQEMDYAQPLIAFRLNRNIKYVSSSLVTSYDETKNKNKKQFSLKVGSEIMNGFIALNDSIMNNIIFEMNLDLANDPTPYNRYTQAVFSLESGTGIFLGKRDDLILRHAAVVYEYDIPQEQKNKLSINYKDGIVYTSKNVASPELVKVSYRIADLRVSYSIGLNVEYNLNEKNVIEYNVNSINRNIAPTNQNIKLYYGKIKNEYDIKDIYEYYTPLIYSIKLGFN